MANHSRIVGNGRVVSAAPPAASGPGESSAEESAQAVPPGAAGGGPVEHQPAGSRDSDQALDQGAKRRNIGGGGALKALEKRAKATASKEPYGNPSDPAVTLYPELWAMFTVRVCESGRSKQPGRISVQAVPGGVQITITDLTLSYACQATSETLQGCFAALEEAMGRDDTWREIGYGERARAVKNDDSKKLAPWKSE